MSKGQAKRLTKQHVSSGGASGIFGEKAQVHEGSVRRAAMSVYEALKRECKKYQFRFREKITKHEINQKLNSIDKRLGKTLFVKESRIKPDGGIIEVQDKDQRASWTMNADLRKPPGTAGHSHQC